MSWFIDLVATRHVCKNEVLFKTLHKVVYREYLYIRNNTSINVHAKGQVELMFTSGNLLVLRDVYYAPNISRNLVLGSLLNRLGYNFI